LAGTAATVAFAQLNSAPPLGVGPASAAGASAAPGAAGAAAKEVVNLQRQGILLMDPRDYDVPLRTKPARQVDLIAHADGFVSQVACKPGEKYASQAELIRLDDMQQALLVERAKGLLAAADVELRMAKNGGNTDLISLAEARKAAADAELRLAEMNRSRMSVKAPFDGEVQRVLVTPGQYVRAGDVLGTIADSTSLVLEVPVDRSQTKAGGEVEFAVEQTLVKAKVLAVLPAPPEFEPLRRLVPSLASASVQIDNSRGTLYAGQSVFSKHVPLKPFALVPILAVRNGLDGQRKVQVVRQGVVRDVTVTTLPQVGENEIFVAGSFTKDDELILASSKELLDGTRIAPAGTTTAAAGGAAGGPNAGTGAGSAQLPTGF
jgi:multidrug efflux pump subunit AcrA (membrane-fusion protein)